MIDRDGITGGGVTAGIDFGLTLTGLLCGDDLAKQIQLAMEYNPSPPFQSGKPNIADEHILEKAMQNSRKVYDERLEIIKGLMQS